MGQTLTAMNNATDGKGGGQTFNPQNLTHWTLNTIWSIWKSMGPGSGDVLLEEQFRKCAVSVVENAVPSGDGCVQIEGVSLTDVFLRGFVNITMNKVFGENVSSHQISQNRFPLFSESRSEVVELLSREGSAFLSSSDFDTTDDSFFIRKLGRILRKQMNSNVYKKMLTTLNNLPQFPADAPIQDLSDASLENYTTVLASRVMERLEQDGSPGNMKAVVSAAAMVVVDGIYRYTNGDMVSPQDEVDNYVATVLNWSDFLFPLTEWLLDVSTQPQKWIQKSVKSCIQCASSSSSSEK